MMKKVIFTSLLGLSVLVVGCGSSDSEGESRLETQQMLDNQDYDGVIVKLKSSARSLDDYVALGSAYMGRAGMSLSDIVSSIAIANDNGSNSTFAGFVSSLSASSSATALSDLDTATAYFEKVVNQACLDTNKTSLSDAQKNLCLYIGLSQTSSAAVTIDLLADDVETFGTDTKDEKLSASTCAMSYAFNRDSGNCSVSESANVNFTITNMNYTPLVVTVNSDTDIPKTEYHYLMNDANRSVLTKGYCTTTDFATRTETFVAGLYACPINETPDAKELTSAGVLVDVLNNGTDSISGSGSDETQGDVDEFKCEILGGTYSNNTCSVSLNNKVSESDVITYLNDQN